MKTENKQYHFILIDDNPIDLFFHDKLLRILKISTHIRSFSDALSAWDYLCSFRAEPESFPETVILLDIQMPDMGGFDLLELMKMLPEQLLQKSHVFMVSSSLDYGDISRCKAHQMIIKLLKKPLDGAELKQLMRKLK